MSAVVEAPAPTTWGPAFWACLHCAALGYPVTDPDPVDRERFERFVQSLVDVVPCEMCRQSSSRMLDVSRADLQLALTEGRTAVFAWTVRFHNTVNFERQVHAISVGEALNIWGAVA